MPDRIKCRRARARRHRRFGDGSLIRMREVVGEPQRHDGENNSERRAAGEAPVGRAGARVVEVEIVHDEESEHGCDRRGHVADIDRAHRVEHFAGRHAHRHDSDDRREHADAAQDQREHDQLDRERARILPVGRDKVRLLQRVCRQDYRRDQRHLVRLEHVGCHAGTVADVVAHVVGNRGGVARVVLGQVLLDFADQVAADVSRLGVDSAADAHEQRRQRAAEAEADKNLHRVFAEHQENDGRAEQSEPDREHPRDSARLEREFHRVLETGERGVGAAHVALDRQPHADVAGAVRRGHAHQKRDRDSERQVQARIDLAVHEEQRDKDDGDEPDHGSDLASEIRHGAELDSVGHVGHRFGSGVGSEHDAYQHDAVSQRDQRRDQHQPQDRHLAAG